jgi:hypothetical protein
VGRIRWEVLAIAAAVALAPIGCSSPQPESGALERVDGGTRITVPVLWADPAAGLGGVEPALVWVGDDAATDFRVELQDLQAKGAGAAWQAASATAAVVGALYSGRDPREVDVWFSVTGPIDGPSAGAFLTVGILAALREVPLIPGVTMTGAVSPDGTISAVGGVGLKLRAAAEAGYDTVLLPPGNTMLKVRGSGETISAVDAGRDLGLQVRHVATISDAYGELTGTALTPGASTPYVLPAAVLAAGEQSARELISEATDLSARMSPDAADRSVVLADLADAEARLRAGDVATAYALAVEAVLLAGRAVTIDQFTTVLAEQGVDAARALLEDEVATALAAAQTALTDGSDVTGLGLEQVVSLPTALTWAAYSRAALQGLAASARDLDTDAQILAAAAVLSEGRETVMYLQPDALDVVRAMPSRLLPSDDWGANYLAGYTGFMARAAEANSAYIADVVLPSIPSASVGIDDVRSIAPILEQLGSARAARAETLQDLSREVQDAAVAITDFVASTAFITATQGFEVAGFNMVTAAPTVADELAVQASFDELRGIIDASTAAAAASGLDAGYPAWSAQWGSAALVALSERDRMGAGVVLAFNELAYDVINLKMLSASVLDQRPRAAS